MHTLSVAIVATTTSDGPFDLDRLQTDVERALGSLPGLTLHGITAGVGDPVAAALRVVEAFWKPDEETPPTGERVPSNQPRRRHDDARWSV